MQLKNPDGHSCYHSRDSYCFTPLETGEHDYFGTRIKVVPINTMIHGLCYKFNLSNPLPLPYNKLQLVIGSSTVGLDKLKKADLFIGAETTWQGTIDGFNKPPLTVSGVFSADLFNQVYVDFEENKQKNLEGIVNYDECMNDERGNDKCASIFDPRPLQ